MNERSLHKKAALFVCFISFFCFFLTSLLTFSPFDPSFFSFSSQEGVLSNKAGFLGSYLAAFAYYLSGCVSFLCLLAFFDAGMIYFFTKRSFYDMKSYFLGWFLFLLFALIFLAEHPASFLKQGIEISGSGVLGSFLSLNAAHYFGLYGENIFLSFLFLSGLILILNNRIFFLAKKMGWTRAFKKPNQKTKPVVKEDQKSLKQDSSVLEEKKDGFHFQKSELIDENLVKEDLEEKKNKILSVLSEFKITGRITCVQTGPSVYIFHFLVDSGIKQARVQTLSEDLALALKVPSIMIEPIFESSAVGIFIPRAKRQLVRFGDILHHEDYDHKQAHLLLPVGLSTSSKLESASLVHMPHLLIAGATGSGKSVAINGIICSLIYQNAPSALKLVLIDPKMLELSVYESIPHLLTPVITEPKKALSALKWCIEEMDARYELLQSKNVRSIEAYNNQEKNNMLPYIAVVIDELSDLILTSTKELEILIQRLAQKSRASGIHMILATQRPSVDVITGVIKANLPARIAFQVASKHDSRTILDQIGAEKLLGKGDMLFLRPGHLKPMRLQGGFISDEEVNAFVAHVRKTYPEKPHYIELRELEESEDFSNNEKEAFSAKEIYIQAKNIALKDEKIDVSFLKKHFSLSHKQATAVMETASD